MSAESILPVARARAESRMVDSGTITRPGAGSSTVNPATGVRTPPAGTLVYSGKCFLEEKRIQNPGATPVAADFPVVAVTSLKLPAQAAAVRRGDIFVLTAAPDHPQDVGLRFRITSTNPGTQLKEQRCQMEAVIG